MTINCDYCNEHLAMQIDVDMTSGDVAHVHPECFVTLRDKYDLRESVMKLTESINHVGFALTHPKKT